MRGSCLFRLPLPFGQAGDPVIQVAPPDTLESLAPEVDEIVCLETHRAFGAIGFFYRDFRQISDDEVIEILNRQAQKVAGAPKSGT